MALLRIRLVGLICKALFTAPRQSQRFANIPYVHPGHTVPSFVTAITICRGAVISSSNSRKPGRFSQVGTIGGWLKASHHREQNPLTDHSCAFDTSCSSIAKQKLPPCESTLGLMPISAHLQCTAERVIMKQRHLLTDCTPSCPFIC
jgi:hypothetical protein